MIGSEVIRGVGTEVIGSGVVRLFGGDDEIGSEVIGGVGADVIGSEVGKEVGADEIGARVERGNGASVALFVHEGIPR